MTDLKDILYYTIANYPELSHLSKARVTKLVYLADWKHSIDQGRQISSIHWFFDNYGPFVDDVYETIKKHQDLFKIDQTSTRFGNPKVAFSLRGENYDPQLPDTAKKAIEHVIANTNRLSFEAFIKLVYSTYPIVSSDKYSMLDLPSQAREYRKMRRA